MRDTSSKQLQAIAISLAVLVGLGGLASCAVNPATGKRQLVLVSEGQEVQLGEENDKAVTAEFGLYEDEELQGYVRNLGKKLAASSERPDLDWTFRVVDDPLVNAFALPGGYIYITRGILAHFNSEAELASVLGHEIGHVTARHSVNQMSKTQLAQIGLGLGTLLSEDVARFGDLAQTGLGVLFLKFSRDDERQADELGLRYVVRNGYDPRPMADVFATLQRVGEARGGDGPPTWMSTHPDPGNRRQTTLDAIRDMKRDLSGSVVRRDEYLAKIDGIPFGDDPRQGYFKGSRFAHPEMKFQMDFPDGWSLQNGRASVGGISKEKDALVRLTLAEGDSADKARRKFFEQEGIARTGSWDGDVHGVPARGASFLATVSDGKLKGQVTFLEHEGRVFQIIGFSMDSRWDAYRAAIEATLGSFRRLTDPAALNVQPQRVEIVTPDRAMTADEFASRYSASVPTAEIALLNGLDRGEPFQAGRSYKVVRGGELP